MSNFDRDPLWAERTESKPPCPECDYTHSPDEAQAIGIFDPTGPFGYIAKHDGGDIYATRQEAMQAVCDRRRNDA